MMTKGLVLSLMGLVLSFLVLAGVAYAQTATPTPTPTPRSISVPGAAPSTGLGGS